MKIHILLAATACAAALALPASAQDWTGFYAGVTAGYGDPSDHSGEVLTFDTNRDGVFNDVVRTGAGADAFSPGFCDGAAIGRTPADGCRTSDGNLSVGLRAGYDWQAGNWVFGGLGEIAKVRIGDDAAGFSTTPASYSFSRDLDYTLAARGRVGYAFDTLLPYATAGAVWGDLDHSFNTTNTANSFTPSDGGDNWGYQLGGGVEWKWSDRISLGVEYLYTSLDDGDYVIDVGRGTAPLTNPFLLTNSAGTYMRRSEDKFEYSTINATMSFRY
jgi:opacity protein-like surface antigen